MDNIPKKKIVSVNISCALFSHLCTHDGFMMQALVWLRVVWFKVL